MSAVAARAARAADAPRLDGRRAVGDSAESAGPPHTAGGNIEYDGLGGLGRAAVDETTGAPRLVDSTAIRFTAHAARTASGARRQPDSSHTAISARAGVGMIRRDRGGSAGDGNTASARGEQSAALGVAAIAAVAARDARRSSLSAAAAAVAGIDRVAADLRALTMTLLCVAKTPPPAALPP